MTGEKRRLQPPSGLPHESADFSSSQGRCMTAIDQNVLREDLPLPLCVLRAAALERNMARFQRYTESAGVLLSPHAKTAMSPALFGRQLAAGCWGLTFATCAQLQVAVAPVSREA